MNLDELELQLRRIPGVLAVGFAEGGPAFLVEVQADPNAAETLPRQVAALAVRNIDGPVAVEIVRWGDGAPVVTPPPRAARRAR